MLQKKECISNVFIDLDGPILDVSERYYQVYRNIIKKLGGRPLDKKTYWNFKRNKIDIGKILKSSNVSLKELPIFRRHWLNSIEKKLFLTYDKVWPYTKTSLDYLKNRYQLILITLRRSPLNLKWQLNKLKLDDYFGLILYKKNNKSSWQVKYNLIKTSRIRLMSSYLIGDTEIDILTGKKLGIKTIVVLCGIRAKDALLRLKPDYTLGSLREIRKILN